MGIRNGRAQGAEPVKIGQLVPGVTISNLVNYPSTNVRLTDFKGKALILDFWATWCSPCIAMIPLMDSLQQQYSGRLQFISVTDQPGELVIPFMKKLERQKNAHYRLPIALNDKVLSGLFPHTTLPHYVWIDGKGVVRAITDQFAITSSNIDAFLKEGILSVDEKKDVPVMTYDRRLPLFTDKIALLDSVKKYQTIFSGFVEALGGGYHFDLYEPGKPRRVTVRNLPISGLFRLAYGGQYRSLGDHKVIYKVKDTSQLNNSAVGAAYEAWMRQGHVFCYELIVPSAQAPHIFEIMQGDLKRFFPQYRAEIKKLDRQCLVLTRTSALEKFKSNGGTSLAQADKFGFELTNATLDYLIVQLDSFYLSNQPYPVIDGTGYTGKADLNIDGSLSSVEAINKSLEKYDLRFELKTAPVEMLVISDADTPL
ncbi:redoxin domain-containing protein [Mucilaginibacter gynuensis]|uniref:Redoxin domain-containing protein n=1 Tax=Mucilaginibacter gynuensis TaxID=1302236 RepID=A0ABP8GXR8_9SPHI